MSVCEKTFVEMEKILQMTCGEMRVGVVEQMEEQVVKVHRFLLLLVRELRNLCFGCV